MLRILLVIALILLMTHAKPVYSQVSGTIYMKNGEAIRVREFRELNVKLFYHWDMWSRRPDKDPGEYFRELDTRGLREISFVYQRDRGNNSFTYRLFMDAITNDDPKYRKRYRSWDWLEIKTPPDSTGKTTRITFFHDKKRYDIDRIVFD